MPRDGHANALTTLSPIVPERLGELKRRLRTVRYVPGLGRPLLELGFIHYARWTIVDGLPPANGAGGWHGLRSKYLLFESNFDGDLDDYLDAFADVLPARIAKVWGACVGFEERVERTHAARGRIIAPHAFRVFVRENSLDVIDYYAAYPEPVSAVRQAIGMQTRIADAEDDQSGGDPVAERIVKIAPMALGPTPGPATFGERFRSVSRPWLDAVLGRYGVNPFTVVTPLARSDAVEAILDEIRRVNPLKHLKNSKRTHFARLVLIPSDVQDTGQREPDRLDSDYLLYTADVNGDSLHHIEELRRRPRLADAIWGHCVNYPRTGHAETFYAWFMNHSLSTRYYVAGYPPRTVPEVQQLIKQRSRVREAYESTLHPRDYTLLTSWDDRDG
jgi:hypothetical protein